MQAFMQSLQMRWPVPGHIGLSTVTIASAPIASPRLRTRVHLGDLLVERAARQRDAERVGGDRAGLVANALRAGVLVALVAEHAVVDLAQDLARACSAGR